MSTSNKLFQAASGVGGAGEYVEDVFATHLYHGNQTAHTLTTNIDLANEGGLLWIKVRTTTGDHVLMDTVRGANDYISSNQTSAEATGSFTQTFTSTGFTLNTSNSLVNDGNQDYVAWNFRKSPGFFDVKTFTAEADQFVTVNHDLGCNIGAVVFKETNGTGDWYFWHKAFSENDIISLNTNSAKQTGQGIISSQTSTSARFYTDANTTSTYVAYFFGDGDDSSAQIFGDDADEAIIKCGSYTGNGSSTGPEVTVGFEPQWLMIRNTGGGNWVMLDVMRGLDLSNIQHMYADTNQAGQAAGSGVVPTADGFRIIDNSPLINQNTETHIYVAIRRPMKTPQYGTDVFSVYGYSDTGLTSGGITASNRTMINGGSNGGSGFPVDTFMHKTRSTATYGLHVFDRLRGKGKSLLTDETAASPAGDGATNGAFDFQEGVDVEYNGEMYYYTSAAGNRTHVTYHWKRAPNFFDTVLYTGNGSNRTIKHNLAQAPKFMFIKRHNGSRNWIGYFASLGNTKYLLGAGGLGTGMNAAATDDGTRFNSTTPTSSVFSVGTNEDVNGNNMQYVAYLWGDVDGVSKVGSYSSDGSNDITVTTGFTPSFVLIKCTSDTSTNWVYFDDHRGLSTGTKLYWNDDAAESSDSDFVITTTSTTMTIKRGHIDINSPSSGKDYVFLAVA